MITRICKFAQACAHECRYHRIQEEFSHPLDSGAEGDCELFDASAGN